MSTASGCALIELLDQGEERVACGGRRQGVQACPPSGRLAVNRIGDLGEDAAGPQAL
jgi:hypothetical protein